MPTTLARIKKAGKRFEVMVDLDQAMQVKKGEASFIEPEGDKIFTDSAKGQVASPNDLKEAFGTDDANSVAVAIVRQGEVQTTQDYRSAEQEQKFKQVVEFLARNAIDPQSRNPISPERIKSALNESGANIKNVPVEQQIPEIMEKLVAIIPIKLETKKVKIIIPAQHTGKVYGIISNYKEKEEWKDDGSLGVVVNVPAGLIMDFYDKLNSVTHGSAVTEEIREE